MSQETGSRRQETPKNERLEDRYKSIGIPALAAAAHLVRKKSHSPQMSAQSAQQDERFEEQR